MNTTKTIGIAILILCACLTLGASAETMMLDATTSTTLTPDGTVIQRIDDDSTYNGLNGAAIHSAYTSDESWNPKYLFQRDTDVLMFVIEYEHDGGYIGVETIGVTNGHAVVRFRVDWHDLGSMDPGTYLLGVYFEPPLPAKGCFDWAVKMDDTPVYGYPPISLPPLNFRIVQED